MTMYSTKFPVPVRICYTAFYQYYDYNVTMFSIEKRTNLVVRTVALIFHTVFYQGVQSVPIDRAVAQ